MLDLLCCPLTVLCEGLEDALTETLRWTLE